MKRASFDEMNCSVAQALEVIGEWWTPLILRDAFFGVKRFDEFQRRLGISRNVLTVRLNHLVEHGILERRRYDDSYDRHDYVLTAKGKALWPVLVTLRQWGDEWLTNPGEAPIVSVHRRCGNETTLSLRCDSCGEVVDLEDLRAHPGPGASETAVLPVAERS